MAQVLLVPNPPFQKISQWKFRLFQQRESSFAQLTRRIWEKSSKIYRDRKFSQVSTTQRATLLRLSTSPSILHDFNTRFFLIHFGYEAIDIFLLINPFLTEVPDIFLPFKHFPFYSDELWSLLGVSPGNIEFRFSREKNNCVWFTILTKKAYR